MAVGDVVEGFVSSSDMDSIEFGQGESVLAAEDVAWADSCLNKDPEIPDNDWSSFKDALLDSISSLNDSSALRKDYFPDEAILENTSSMEEIVDEQNSNTTDVSVASSNDGAESSSNDIINIENTEDFWSRYDEEDVFLPTYNENLRDLGPSDPDVGLYFQISELEQTNDEIFKIWDLEIPPEEAEDNLIKQLNKALLQESLLEPTTSVSGDLEIFRELKEVSINDLISGIEELSLSPSSG